MKVLHISLGKHQTSLTNALKSVATEYKMIDWTENPNSLNAAIKALLLTFKPDLTFMQLQRNGLVTPETLNLITGKKYSWTGDVRELKEMQWYIDLAPYLDATLFSNNTDVVTFKEMGLRAEFLNIGFEEPIYKLEGNKIKSGVVFMGNNYVDRFPLSKFRADMVKAVPNIEAYGGGFGKSTNPQQEAAIYRGCKMAISLSHFDYDRYSSDRMLRIMACGALCLSYHYKGIEKDFEVGTELDTWVNFNELNELIAYYSLNPDVAKQVALNGYKRVYKDHTWKKRIDDLVELAQVR